MMNMTDKKNNQRKQPSRFWLIAVIMGLGHLRAAYPFRDWALQGKILETSSDFCSFDEYHLWNRLREWYYKMSRATAIPWAGKLALVLVRWSQFIPPLDTPHQHSAGFAVWFLHFLIKTKRLGASLHKLTELHRTPQIHTFYATALAIDYWQKSSFNYLVICDTDIHRIWAALDTRDSHINYLVPCRKARQRLLAYGVPIDHIHLTGFPLPPENIGDQENQEILKMDLSRRLRTLDPNGCLDESSKQAVAKFLGTEYLSIPAVSPPTLMFAVGGAGAQLRHLKTVLENLAPYIRSGQLQIVLSAGIQESVYESFFNFIFQLKLVEELKHKKIRIVYSHKYSEYFDRFNLELRNTDLIWTKPSELSFYCGLGIPILINPPLGTHEESNRNWLLEVGAGIDIPSVDKQFYYWFKQRLQDGSWAAMAWRGCQRVRKLGTFRIINLIENQMKSAYPKY